MAQILVTAPSLYAFKDFKSPTVLSILCMVLNVALNALFIFGLGWGAASVAAATSLAAFFNAALLYRLLSKKMQASMGIRKDLAKICCASTLGLLAVLLADYAVWESVPVWDLLRGHTPYIPEQTLSQLQALIRETGVFAGVTGGILVWQGFLSKKS
jgi:peptidoglycan biosynthesis protein MviN/MurJ (putative lipid II flippase)